ncbi:MAG: hypothetical protein JXA10_17720 [Anaerolineae bacterium]|nr:hypothetical protein [Anaerolineae bacterium]
MTNHLPDTDRGLPRVIIAQHVIDKMVRGALLYPGYETGEAMVGFIVEQEDRLEPDIYILDTISPGDNAVRQWGKFEQGSEWQGDVFHWFHINWEAFRESLLPNTPTAAQDWNLPLRFVGDWHKQPGSMIAPSGGDLQTARGMIADPETPDHQLVAPIITLYRVRNEEAADETPEAGEVDAADTAEPTLAQMVNIEVKLPPTLDFAPAEAEATPLKLVKLGQDFELDDEDEFDENSPAPDPENLPANALVRPSEDGEWVIRVDFWYISRRLMRNFAPVVPIIWPDERLPHLPEAPWHLMHPRRFDQEVQLLAEAGYAVDIVRWDADGNPPYEICFSIYKPGTHHIFIIVTPVDYPSEMPALRVAPLVRVAEDEDVFEKLYQASKPLLLTQLPAWPWDSKRTLIELVWHLEKTDKG